MWPEYNPAKDYSADKHDVVSQVGVLHMTSYLYTNSHVYFHAIHSCIITAARREALTTGVSQTALTECVHSDGAIPSGR